jgi:hypothetical protein
MPTDTQRFVLGILKLLLRTRKPKQLPSDIRSEVRQIAVSEFDSGPHVNPPTR